jgi:hypothetical protein
MVPGKLFYLQTKREYDFSRMLVGEDMVEYNYDEDDILVCPVFLPFLIPRCI